MDPKIAKKTQDTLGKLIKKPPLTEKLLGKPPFRFLHDVTTSVIKTTGFMQGLFTEQEMNSENVKEKDAKIAFLQKAIDMVSAVNGKPVSAKPIKIVAGHEPEKTNEFLQALADAINKNVNNDEFVRKVLKVGGTGSTKETKKEESKEKEKTRSSDKKKERDSGEKEKTEKEGRERDKSRDKGEREKDRQERDKERDRHKDREKDRESKRERSREGREREEKHTEKEERHRDKDEKRKDKEVRPEKEEKQRDKEDRTKEKAKKTDNSKEKENEAPSAINGEKDETQDAPARLQRPSSAKGSRRRREGKKNGEGDDGLDDEEDEEFQKPSAGTDSQIGEGDLPPQVMAARQLARPSSARPAPPRPKQEAVESEPAMRLGSGKPTNLIVDNEEDDDDENFLVEESAPPLPDTDLTPIKPTEDDDHEHGALVKKMLESKKELEGSKNQVGKKTEIERPTMSDAQRRKQREIVQKEVDKLRASIQSLTRSANPLGKVMDYVQEDLDSMQQELDKWRAENAQHALDLKRETNVTDRAVEPLKQQLTELDRAIKDQLDQIAATKANIIKNDQKIQKMLKGISNS
ncbi:TRAF3-interacting protein 1-like isoform X2 [Physella acuta]|uniref:TRAF3-interacting protein 1-like isoform X2 n=1 Tax=Physella acuta TaxID=109671 RepID=UPI0027DD5773|nr:TRAF3-interacting protein 1-like isoform X2 [Physella acuta]